MYFAEEVINGVLCWKSSPDGEWTPYTIQELSTRCVRLEKHDAALRALTAELVKAVTAYQAHLQNECLMSASLRPSTQQSWRQEMAAIAQLLAKAEAAGLSIVQQCQSDPQNPPPEEKS